MSNTLMDAPDVLKKIAAYKKNEVLLLKSTTTIDLLRDSAKNISAPKGFLRAIKKSKHRAVIAEIKKASPSKGVICNNFNPIKIAKEFESAGATCMSVLTDRPGFQGSNEIFKQVRENTKLPLLRKDFMIDPIQITESRVMGADCILIIMAMVNDLTAKLLLNESKEMGMDALVETHNDSELERAIKLGADLIGINNRDLRTFQTSLATFGKLSSKAPKGTTLIAESGINTRSDIKKLEKQGAHGYLIGESLMRENNISITLNNFVK
ncbi:MAG: indole-3-glycerol phosphate synthase TrpC [Hellea sp.]|nr:indole-3-glycerol phosphate synthase TrpC [Hellea sp.]